MRRPSSARSSSSSTIKARTGAYVLDEREFVAAEWQPEYRTLRIEHRGGGAIEVGVPNGVDVPDG